MAGYKRRLFLYITLIESCGLSSSPTQPVLREIASSKTTVEVGDGRRARACVRA